MKKEPKYVEWLSADVMHEDSMNWLSELNFIDDELRFFSDLIKDYTIELIKPQYFADSERMIQKLINLCCANEALIKSVQLHEKGLKLMVDGIDQPKEERDYKDVHRKLIVQMNAYLKDYRIVKMQIFELMKLILKEGKEKRLLQGGTREINP